MNLQDLKLIALQQALTLYKNKDISACKGNIDISTIKKQLTHDTSFNELGPNCDIDINIKNTIEEPDVTIVNQTVKCDEKQAPSTDKETVEVTNLTEYSDKEPSTEQTESIINTENSSYGIKGKLFQYFKGGNNAEK
jgi:hypothetical protein